MKKVITFILGGLMFAGTVRAQESSALIDALVDKDIFTQADADRIRARMAKEEARTAAGKLKLSDSITELRLSGDTRLRYQYEQADSQLDAPSTGGTAASVGSSPNVNQRSRWRFRLRLNADVKFGKNFFAGFGLQTQQAADSGMQTFEDGFDNYGIFINKAFLGWKNDWLTVIAGKQANPFYTTELVWDADINPNGLTEAIDLGKAFFPDSKFSLQLIAGQFIFDDNNEFSLDHDLSTDAYLFVEQLKGTWKFNKDTSITMAPGFMTFTAADLTGLRNNRGFTDAGALGVVTTQQTRTERRRIILTYDAAGNPIAAVASSSVQRFVIDATQVTPGAGRQTRTVDTKQVRTGAPRVLTAAELALFPAKGAPGSQIQRDLDDVNVVSTNTSGFPAVSGETRSLYILTAPGELTFKIAGLKSKVYWDFAYNFNGGERFSQIYGLSRAGAGNDYDSRDALAWLVGFQLGTNKNAGDWSIYVNYREIGVASIDPNLNDSDWSLSALNLRGIKTAVTFCFTDWLLGTVSYAHGWNMKKNLIGGFATNAPAIADLNDVDVLQVDMEWKF